MDDLRAAADVTGRDAPATDDRHAAKDYVLGTNDTETRRLGVQHDAWRPCVLDCWRRAGVTAGAHVIDVGAGPGYAALDLADLVGPSGYVAAIERSPTFVEAGRAAIRERGVRNVRYYELDLMSDPLPEEHYDVAWCRWVNSFVESPEVLVSKIAGAVRPGGVAVFHEYVDYASWRFSPSLPDVEEYIRRVMESWRAAGGEPDVAMGLPPLLKGEGFVIREAVPRVFCVRPGDDLWRWIATFVESNFERLTEIGAWDPDRIDAARAEFAAAAADPDTLMLTPMVLEIIADRVR